MSGHLVFQGDGRPRRWLCLVLLLLGLAGSGPSLAVPASVQGLPQIADLAARNAAVVVNITATQAKSSSKTPYMREPQERELPDWLKRLVPRHSQPQPEEEGGASGSGFIVASEGYILTNAHVVEAADEILVRLSDRREFAARLVGLDKRTDIALLKVEASGLPRARLGDVRSLRVGDWVVAIGSPFGFDSSVTAGIVSAKGRSLPDETLVPFIQTDVAINPGNSGGPLFNLQGEVVGINSQIYSRSGGFMGISFAIPIDVAMDVQAQLRQEGRVRRGRIGVVIQDVTREIADSFGLREAAGAIVSRVDPDGPAAGVGVRVGDIVLRFDGQLVGGSADLPRIVGATRPGSRSVMAVWRDGALRNLPVTVSEFPDDSPRLLARSTPVPQAGNRLGLVTQDLSREQKRDLELDRGAAIREATGAAARAELRPGDVITALISKGSSSEVRSAEHFNRISESLPRGSAVTLLVRRGDAQNFVGIKVPEGK